MKPSTFTPKPLRERNFLRFLLPLLALFVGLGASQQAMAQLVNTDNITITANPAGAGATTTTYDGTPPDLGATNPKLQGADLGGGAQFDLATGSLTINGGLFNVSTTSTRPFASNAQLFYRVYLVGATTQPSYSSYNLPLTTANTGDPVIFQATGNSVNLLTQSSVLGGGTYVLEVVFSANYTRSGTTYTLADPSSTTGGYQATFRVLAPAVTPPNGTTTWIATVSTEWTSPANWSNGVPTQFSDATIPEKNNTNTNTSTPALLDPNPSLYNVRTLTLQGTTNATRGLLRIGQTLNGSTTGATLNVYGDLNTFGGGILGSQTGANGVQNSALNSTIAMRGDVQVVRGLLEIADITMSGAGNKLVVNAINTSNTFTFLPGTTGRVRTVTETIDPATGMSTFTLNTTKTANVNLKSTGLLFGETNVAYIEGVALADRNLLAGQTQTFGNIGVDITPNRDILGPTVQITRTVGDPLSGPVGTSARPVKRQYGVSGDVNNAPTVSTLTFHYLDSADELNGNPEPNLTIFKTSNNGIPYQLIGGTDDPAANTVTQTGVRAINTITLGDKNNPLPVTVSSFDAKRAGSDALISWTTAQEINSKGFNVQVSTDGTEYRTVGFVASSSPSSSSARSYSFLDTEKNKVGVRYYRLQQVDVDGKTAFFAPRAVTFEGKSTAAGVLAYPNPFTTEVRLSLNSTVSGNGLVRIADMTGRTISQYQLPISTGANDIAVDNVANLKNGLYVLTVTLPSGETKSMKVMKQ